VGTPLEDKSSVSDIRKRFDGEVERFSNLETGTATIVDASLVMELITQAALKSTPNIQRVLDIGCGAGNTTLKLCEYVSPFDCDLVDLSLPMLEKAHERIAAVNAGKIRIWQGDFREINLPAHGFDVILAAAVLHHLRDNPDWQKTFKKIYQLTAPGGSVWITDLVAQETEPVQALIWQRYGEYLCALGGEEYQQKVFDYIDREDSPRPVTYQLDLLHKVGYDQVELLHKNTCFAAFGAIKTAR